MEEEQYKGRESFMECHLTGGGDRGRDACHGWQDKGVLLLALLLQGGRAKGE